MSPMRAANGIYLVAPADCLSPFAFISVIDNDCRPAIKPNHAITPELHLQPFVAYATKGCRFKTPAVYAVKSLLEYVLPGIRRERAARGFHYHGSRKANHARVARTTFCRICDKRL